MTGSSSDNRTKKAKKNAILLLILKGFSLSITFFYVPLLLHTLKADEYGIWLTLSSMVAWVGIFDIGLGNGLRNKLSEALALKDTKKARELVSTAYVCIFTIVTCLLVLYYCATPFINWNDVLNADESGIENLHLLVNIVFTSFCIQFGLGLINSVLLALQMPVISSLTLFFSQLLSFISVYILAHYFQVTSLLVYGSIISILPPLCMLVATLILFFSHYSYLRPSLKLYHRENVKSIFSLGIKFFILQIITLVIFYSNNLIITHIVNPEAVVEYNVMYKYVHLLTMVFGIIVTPIWSATSEAYTLGDFGWIRSINRRLMQVAGLLVCAGIVMFAFSSLAFKLWLGDNTLTLSKITLGIMFIQSFFSIIYSSYGYILNGMGKLKIQMIITAILAIVYVPFSIWFGNMWGLNGIMFVFALTAGANALWSRIQYSRIINNRATGIWNE